MQHLPRITRRTLGADAIKGSRTRYGTNVTCTCGKWATFNNDKTPAQGGQAWAERAHAERHLPNTTVQGDILILKVLIEMKQRHLAEAIESELSSFIEGHSKRLSELVEQLLADMRAQASAEMNEEN